MILISLPIIILQQTKFEDCLEFKKNDSPIIHHMFIGGSKKKSSWQRLSVYLCGAIKILFS